MPLITSLTAGLKPAFSFPESLQLVETGVAPPRANTSGLSTVAVVSVASDTIDAILRVGQGGCGGDDLPARTFDAHERFEREDVVVDNEAGDRASAPSASPRSPMPSLAGAVTSASNLPRIVLTSHASSLDVVAPPVLKPREPADLSQRAIGSIPAGDLASDMSLRQQAMVAVASALVRPFALLGTCPRCGQRLWKRTCSCKAPRRSR